MPGYSELSRGGCAAPGQCEGAHRTRDLLLAGKQQERAEEQAKAVLGDQAGRSRCVCAALEHCRFARRQSGGAEKHTAGAYARSESRLVSYRFGHDSGGVTIRIRAEAEDQLRKAVSLDAHNATSHLALASMLERKGDLGGALEQDKAAVAADPKSMMARSSLAELYLRQGG